MLLLLLLLLLPDLGFGRKGPQQKHVTGFPAARGAGVVKDLWLLIRWAEALMDIHMHCMPTYAHTYVCVYIYTQIFLYMYFYIYISYLQIIYIYIYL